MKTRGIIFGLLLAIPSGAYAQSTVVIHVIQERQKERERSRFSLLEWLKIKERMKEMDVWLALASDPKSKFSPELNLAYYSLDQEFSLGGEEVKNEKSYSAEGTLWLTNLVSASLGVKSLNIDFGVEGRKSALQYTQDGLSLDSLEEGGSLERFGCFRLFGKHSQDSTLELRYGLHSGKILLNGDSGLYQPSIKGEAYGAALQVYLGRWLGLTGEKMVKISEDKSEVNSVHSSRWGGFIEVSLLRLEYHVTQEDIYSAYGTEDPRFGKKLGISLKF